MLNLRAFVTGSTLIAILWLFASCRDGGSPEETSDFGFRWDTPIQFAVEETATKKDMNARILHKFRITKEGDEFLLKWLDAEFISINGQSASAPELQQELAPARAMWIAWPPMRINAEGEFLGTSHTKEAIEEINRLLDKAFPERPDSVRQFYSRMADSAEGQSLADSAMDQRYWNTWVGAWIDFAILPGQSQTNEATSIIGSQEFACTNIITNLGSVGDGNHLSHLRFEQTAQGPDVGKAIASIAAIASRAGGVAPDSPFPEITTADFRLVLEVQTNPTNLKPQFAKRVVSMTMKNPEIGEVAVHESYEFRFIWDMSELKKRN